MKIVWILLLLSISLSTSFSAYAGGPFRFVNSENKKILYIKIGKNWKRLDRRTLAALLSTRTPSPIQLKVRNQFARLLKMSQNDLFQLTLNLLDSKRPEVSRDELVLIRKRMGKEKFRYVRPRRSKEVFLQIKNGKKWKFISRNLFSDLLRKREGLGALGRFLHVDPQVLKAAISQSPLPLEKRVVTFSDLKKIQNRAASNSPVMAPDQPGPTPKKREPDSNPKEVALAPEKLGEWVALVESKKEPKKIPKKEEPRFEPFIKKLPKSDLSVPPLTSESKQVAFRFEPSPNYAYQQLQIKKGDKDWEPADRDFVSRFLESKILSEDQSEAKKKLIRFLNLSSADSKALGNVLKSSPLSNEVSFGDFRSFMARDQRKFKMELAQDGRAYLKIKRVLKGVEKWENVEPGKIVVLLEENLLKSPSIPSQNLTAGAFVEYLRTQAGVKASFKDILNHFRKLKSKAAVSDQDLEKLSTKSLGTDLATLSDQVQMPSSTDFTECSLDKETPASPTIPGVFKKSVAKKKDEETKSAPKSAEIGAPAGIHIVWSGTKEKLFDEFGNDLDRVITELDQKKGGDPRGVDPRILKSKAKIFRRGLSVAREMLNRNSYKNEKTEVLQFAPVGRSSSLEIATLPAKPRAQFQSHWMDYSHQYIKESPDPNKSQTFVNFANNRLGGSWRGHGNVQEEQMAQRSPEFAALLAHFNPTRDQHQLYTRTPLNGDPENGKYPHQGSANPILITNVRFLLTQGDQAAKASTFHMRKDDKDFSKIPKGALIYRDYDAARAFQEARDAPPVNMLAIAAPEIKSKGQIYSKDLIQDMYTNAYEGFRLVKVRDQARGKSTKITSGLWGAGAFGHNAKMSIALQYLAARAAGVDEIEFTGISDSSGHQAIIKEIDQILENQISKGEISIPSVLHRLETQQWRTR